MIKPPKLQPGDKVAVVSLAWGGPALFPHRYQVGKAQLAAEFGVTVVDMPHALADPAWLERNPKARADDLMAAFADPSIKAILASIGGDDSIRTLPYTDLAVIRVAKLPNDVRPVPVGPLATAGAGVHAIGHPFGETWTYTQGVVSGVTANYSWASDDGLKHRADVVRMHMPTNPGNSGASFLNDAGELVGVNGFSHMQGSDVNFAIAATDARRVLAARADRLAPVKADAVPRADKAAYCTPVRLSTSRSKANDATQFLLDTNCDGRGDATLSVPDSRARPTTLAADTNGNGKTDVTYVDENNDLKFDKALYDTNEDGATDMIGYDLNDSLEPGRIVLARA